MKPGKASNEHADVAGRGRATGPDAPLRVVQAPQSSHALSDGNTSQPRMADRSAGVSDRMVWARERVRAADSGGMVPV